LSQISTLLGGQGAETRLTLREGKETRRHVDFMPPRLRCRGKEGKRGGVWAPCRLVFDAPGKSGNEAACGLHTTSSSMPREGETRRHVVSTPSRCRCRRKEGKQRGGVWVSRDLAGFWTPPWSRLFSSPQPPRCFPPRLPSLTTGC